MLTLGGGTAIGQVIALLGAPVLSRLYSPADFGVLTIVTGVAAVLATVMALRMELAVPLPKEESTAYAIVHVGLCAIALATAVASAVLLLVGDKVAAAFGQPQLMPWLTAAPVLAAALASSMVLNALAVRARRYPAIARRKVLQSVATILAQIGIGLTALHTGGLLVGYGTGQAVGTASFLQGSGLRSPTARAGRCWPAMREVLARYRRFPLVLGPAGLLNSAGTYLPIMLLAYLYGGEVAGWIGLTQKVLAVPVALVGAATAQVYLGELSRDLRHGSGAAIAMFRAATLRLSMVGLPAAAGLLIGGPWVFSLVFGEAWRMSGQFAQAMAVSLAAQLVASPLSQTLIVYERQRLQLCWDAARLFLTAGAVVAAAHLGSPALVAAWALGVALTLTYLVSWVLSRAVVRSANAH